MLMKQNVNNDVTKDSPIMFLFFMFRSQHYKHDFEKPSKIYILCQLDIYIVQADVMPFII